VHLFALCVGLHIYAPLCLYACANMNNASKLLLTPRQGATFVAAAAAGAISDRQDIASYHDISSLRYMQLRVGLSSEERNQNECFILLGILAVKSNTEFWPSF